MDYTHEASSRDKERVHKDLKAAREELLQQAKERAELRTKREHTEIKRLPKTAHKADKSLKSSRHERKPKSVKSKRSQKKKHKKRQSSSDSSSSSSSDSDSDSDSTSSSSSSSSEDEKERKRRKKKSRRTRHDIKDEWVEITAKVQDSGAEPLQRDSWMTSDTSLMLKTFTQKRNKPNEPKQPNIDDYDPAKSKYELNPYWKSNGTGMPGFQKPKGDDDHDNDIRMRSSAQSSSFSLQQSSTRNWQKQSTVPISKTNFNEVPIVPSSPKQHTATADDSKSQSDQQQISSESQFTELLDDEQLNILAAKAIKAEIKGKVELAAELNRQLEAARQVRAANSNKNGVHRRFERKKSASEHILLTRTDQRGNVRPLAQTRTRDNAAESNTAYGGRSGDKRNRSNKRRVDTHEDGQRVRYFADDDRYDIKQMFEREKHATAEDSNLLFADIISKHKNPNDDLEDIFADKVRKNISEADADKQEMQKAISEHAKLTAALDNCAYCFESAKLEKDLIVSIGVKVYLTLPWHVGLQNGHCILTSMQHVTCCTQLDEDAWSELSAYRRSLTRMFAEQRKEVVFYEIANKLYKRAHLTVHCIPVPDSRAEMVPFYFKKAIEESEQEWCVNKQLVSLKQKSLRAAIPKGLPYLWVHFGMESGFAHVIEDQDRFPSNFVQEIIGGMLELNPNTWRKPRKEQNSTAKVKSITEQWKKFDCNERNQV